MTKPQTIFKNCVDKFVKDEDDFWKREMPKHKHETNISFPYTFHDNKSVSVDSVLYEILNYGQADFGYGRQLGEKIYNELKKAGYYMDNINGCDWIFAKN